MAEEDKTEKLGYVDIKMVPTEDHIYIPYQLCPKCNSQVIVSKPPGIAGDVNQWTSDSIVYTCDVCNRVKIITMCKINQYEKRIK